MSWPTVKLGDVMTVGRGSSPRPIKDERFFTGGTIPWVKIADATASGKFIYQTNQHVNEYGASFSRKLKPGSLIFPASGTLGIPRFLGVEACIHDGWLYFSDYQGIDPDWLYYRIILLKEYYEGVAYGAAIQNINTDLVRNTEIQLPDLPTQRAMTAVLSAYDELIATNLRRIALLEDAARRLYREWFVHLRFPGHETVPVKDGVPEGWRKTPIAEQTSFLNRGIAPKYDDTAKGRVINQKCIREGRISMEPARRQSKDVKPDRLVRVGDVLINSTGAGTLGRVALVRAPIEDCTVDTHVTVARPIDEGASTYFGQALLNLEPVFSEMGKGATNQLELSRSDIGAVEIWQPPQHVHVEFHRLVRPMLEQAELLSAANLSLAKARDLLLPKLMTGQLDVSGISLPEVLAA